MALSLVRKAVLDTNVFVDYLRSGLHEDWVVGRVENVVRFLSSVVLLELRLGVNSPRRERAVDGIRASFPSRRMVTPAGRVFDHAGKLFRNIHGDGSGLADRLGAVNDILIALTARAIGAVVVTRNVGDFRRIAERVSGLRIIDPTG